MAILTTNYGWTAGGDSIPEPATLGLFGCTSGLYALGKRRRK